IRPLEGLGEITPGTGLGGLIADIALPHDGEIVVLSQKIVSKAEGRVRRLDEVTPGAEAERIAAATDKDPRMVELILGESREVLREAPGVLITETHSGWICANAGIDASNVGDGEVALLPEDSDASARRIRA